MYWMKVVFKMLPFIHAIFNPIIYFAMSKNFRKMSILKLKNWSECQVLSKPIQHQHSSIALRGNAYAMTTTETAIENFRMEGKVSSKEANALSSQGMLTHLMRQKYHTVFSGSGKSWQIPWLSSDHCDFRNLAVSPEYVLTLTLLPEAERVCGN